MGLERRHLGKQRRFPNQFEHAACAVSFYIFLDYPYLPNPSSNFQVILRFYPLLARVNTKDQGYDGTRTNERIVFKIQPIFVRSNNRAKRRLKRAAQVYTQRSANVTDGVTICLTFVVHLQLEGSIQGVVRGAASVAIVTVQLTDQIVDHLVYPPQLLQGNRLVN